MTEKEFEMFFNSLSRKENAEKVILNDKELIELLGAMLNIGGQEVKQPEKPRPVNSNVVYLYVLERTLANGTKHYHPVIANQMPTFVAKDYKLMAGSNLLELQREYEYISHYPGVKIMAISYEQYGNIMNALHKFAQAIINKVEEATRPLATINVKGYNIDYIKADMLTKIFAASESVGHALLENGTIVNVTADTEYVEDYEDDEYDEYDEYDEEDWD